ncbi:MAG: group III truncated hemoglobin [Pyrinomonadaceae bacterium]|nr:group III truncated hemoglobin [Pyrinomonadaceae bacterium]
MIRDIEDRNDIDRLMLRFYSRVMADDLIGYIFTDVAKLDLDRHLPVIGDFWETIIFQTGVYTRHGRNPLQVHGELNEKEPLLPEHFRRWLEIFTQITDELFAGEKADFIKVRAAAIAERMMQFVGGVQRGEISFPRSV